MWSSQTPRTASHVRGAALALPLVAAAVVLVLGGGLALAHGPSQAGPALLLSPTATSPSPSPSDTIPPLTVASGAPQGWSDEPVTVTLKANDNTGGSGVASISYSIDGGAIVIVPGATALVAFAAPADHAGDGVHTLSFYATDLAGNVEAAQTLQVSIATRPPRLVWRGLAPALVRRTEPLRLRFVLGDETGSVKVATSIYDAYGVLVARARLAHLTSGARELSLWPRYDDGQPLLPGLYHVRLALTDVAGNKALSGPIAFRDFRPVRAIVWRSVPHAGRRVALTFDDGYDKAGWAAVLAALHAAHVHATLFVNGRYVVGYPTLARRTIAWGEVVGSHTWSHILTTTETPAQIKAQIEGDVDAWWRVARATPVPYFRPPYGGYDSTTLAMAGSLGFARVMLWSVDPSDYTQPGAGVIVACVLAAVRPGAIVELHLLPQTAAALPNLIAGLRARGYSLVTLPQLFRAAGDS